MKLTVLATREAETTLCTYCPKLCRPACPVSTVEGRETVTPWGKMRAMGELIRGVAEPDAAHRAPAYACMGCMRCFEMCDLDNPVADTLRDGRIDAFRAGEAPAAARAFVETFEARERKLADAAREVSGGRGHVAFVPGCTQTMFFRGEVPGMARAIERLHSACEVVADRCCGLPLLEAGDRDGFLARAKAFAERTSRFDRIVTPDAGCAHALRVLYPAHGVAVPRVQHLTELAASVLPSIPPLADAPARVAYHDPCRLGRGLGVYEPPRAVLTRLLGRAPLELAERRERSACSGGGAIVPVTMPETASAIAEELHGLVREAEAEVVATACATSRRMLEARGANATDVSALVARAMGGG